MPNIEKINGLATSSIEKIGGIALTSIENINGLTVSSAAALFDVTWNFDDQTTYLSTSGAGWVTGTGNHVGWLGGAAACSGTGGDWTESVQSADSDLDTDRTVTGFRVDTNATGSSGTGPDGAHNGSGGHDTSSTTKYIFAETSGSLDTNNQFLARTPGYNFSTEMSDTSNNLNLKFYVHAFGTDMGILKVYYDNATSSESGDATLLVTCTGSTVSGNTRLTNVAETGSSISPASQDWSGTSSNWIQFTVSLNSLRSLNDTYYIYFLYEPDDDAGVNSFKGDLAIDDVQIVEEE